ncbi:toxin-antitoxin system YwqK family antitoxin [Nocardia cyriacigeorgica]|uniref:toxin-antitoxin system YwqK family antitoxin n=1 Tax=Nocardia cyriacigeorgica TaxID=135487 RepID=UPI0018727C0A|nr:hypothetical protein [Nocardia cyriacigeorgica]
MKRIDLNVDEVTTGDDLRLEYEGEPFTGEVVETVAGMMISQEFYVDGINDGPTREWWGDGVLKSEGTTRRGRPTGLYRDWHSNGRLACERVFDERGRLTEVRTWDEKWTPDECMKTGRPHVECSGCPHDPGTDKASPCSQFERQAMI